MSLLSDEQWEYIGRVHDLIFSYGDIKPDLDLEVSMGHALVSILVYKNNGSSEGFKTYFNGNMNLIRRADVTISDPHIIKRDMPFECVRTLVFGDKIRVTGTNTRYVRLGSCVWSE